MCLEILQCIKHKNRSSTKGIRLDKLKRLRSDAERVVLTKRPVLPKISEDSEKEQITSTEETHSVHQSE